MPTNIVYRLTEPASGHLSGYSKGAPLTMEEIDKNFKSVVNELETKANANAGAISGASITASSVNNSVVGGTTPTSGFFTAITSYTATISGLNVITDAGVSGNLSVGGSVTGSGYGITNLNAANLVSGIVSIARGGTNTNAAPTAGAVAYGTGTAYAFTAVGTSGYLLTSMGFDPPVWQPAPIGTLVGSKTATMTTHYPVFVDATGAMASGYIDDSGGNPLTYIPGSGVLTTSFFKGSVSGCTQVPAAQLYGTVAATQGVDAGSASASFLKYMGTAAGTAGQFDSSSTNPSATTRLNYNGYLYATRFYGNGSQLTALNADNISTGTLSADLGLLASSSESGFIKYTGATKTQAAWYRGTTAPTNTNRLNYDGDLWATNMYTGTVSGTTFTASTTVNAPTATFNGTSNITIPVGTIGQRPSAATGRIRYNSDLNQYEGATASAWLPLSGGMQWGLVTTNHTAAIGAGILMNTSSAAKTVTLPSTGLFAGAMVGVKDLKQNCNTYNITIQSAGAGIRIENGSAGNTVVMNIAGDCWMLVFDGVDNWAVVSRLYAPAVYA